MKIKQILKDFFWLIDFGFKNLKLKTLTALGLKNSQVYRLLIKVNNSCNYRCISCGNWKNKRDTFIPKEKRRGVLKKYNNQLYFLSLTGGEPFLQEKKLFNLVKEIKKRNPKLKYISANTNCSQPEQVEWFSRKLLTQFPDLNLHIGLHYIPNKRWGEKETGIESAYKNYKKTREVVERLEAEFAKKSLHGKGFTFYNIVTIHKPENFRAINPEKDLWMGFAIINDQFYNNEGKNHIGKITPEEKVEMIDKIIEMNKKNMTLLNKISIKNTKKILKNKIRKRRCYAGINRKYINPQGEIFACSRGIKKRDDMSSETCSDCWTSCESNFDLVADFFLPSILNRHEKDIQNHE